MKISLILLVKNGQKRLNGVFEALDKQSVKIDEMVIVDSGSTDASLELVKSYKVIKLKSLRIFQIAPEEFSHGGTRNFAVSKTSGDIVVFLSQDAVPIDKDWLKNLIKPLIIQRHSGESLGYARDKLRDSRIKNGFWTSQNDEESNQNDEEKNNQIVGVFGRQIPWPETDICEKFFYGESYPDIKRIMEKKDSESFSNKNIFFSNVNAAVKKDFLLKFPFRKDLIMSEDQFWGREVLRADYKIVYEPKAAVWHSHNYSLVELFKRYVQSGYSQKQMNLKGDVLEKGAGTAFGLLDYVLKNKPWLLPYAVVYEAVKGTAFLLGRSGICF